MMQKAIGTLLKERRTKLDWSLDKAEKQTSIKKIYISALETDNHSIFPSPFYVRAYLKQYAQRLDLDTDAILDAFDKGIPVEVEGPFEDTGNYRFIRPDEREVVYYDESDEQPQSWFHRYLPMILLSSFAIIILVVVGVIVFMNYPKESSVSTDNYSLSQSSTSSSSASSSSSTTSTSAATTITHSADGATIQIKSGQNPVQIVFTLNANIAAATASVTGTVTQTANLTSSQATATVYLEKDVTETTLTLSDYRAFDIQINGQTLNLSDVPTPPNTFTLEITY